VIVDNETDKAREYLKKYMGRVYHDYIDNSLAGDFAYTLAGEITALESKLKAAEEELSKRVPFEAACDVCCHADTEDEEPHCNLCSKTPSPDNCPIIPKAQP
jgi:hypothetical protein